MSGSGVATLATSSSSDTNSLVFIMLDVARTMGLIYEGTATGGSTTTLEDTGLEYHADYYSGGTIWITSGGNIGVCEKVKTHNGNTMSFDTMDTAIVSGVTYAIANADYPKQQLKQAVLNVLRHDECLLKNDTTVVIDDTEEYTLPTGVSNLIAVQVATNDEKPYSFTAHYYWREYDGLLIFDKGRYPTATGNIIRLWYLGYHGTIGESESVEATVPIKWLVWKSVENLYRNKLTRIKQDDPTTIDLFNEAKENAKYAAAMSERYALRSGNPQPRFANY